MYLMWTRRLLRAGFCLLSRLLVGRRSNLAFELQVRRAGLFDLGANGEATVQVSIIAVGHFTVFVLNFNSKSNSVDT